MIKGFFRWLEECDHRTAQKHQEKRRAWLKDRNRTLAINLAKWEAELAEVSRWFKKEEKTGKYTTKTDADINHEAGLKADIAGAKKELELNNLELESHKTI